MIVVKMGEKYLRDILRVDAALIEALVGAAPDIEQQHFPVGFDQGRYPEPVREIFRPARSHQRDLHPGVIGASRRHGLSHDHRHQRQRCCNPANH